MSVTEAEKNFSGLINLVYVEGVCIELERDNRVIARITPAGLASSMKVRDLNTFLDSLPKLGDDAEIFADDLRAVRREFPAEANPCPQQKN